MAEHPWPQPHGGVGGRYGSTALAAPANLTRIHAWSWQDPRGKYRNMLVGTMHAEKGHGKSQRARGLGGNSTLPRRAPARTRRTPEAGTGLPQRTNPHPPPLPHTLQVAH